MEDGSADGVIRPVSGCEMFAPTPPTKRQRSWRLNVWCAAFTTGHAHAIPEPHRPARGRFGEHVLKQPPSKAVPTHTSGLVTCAHASVRSRKPLRSSGQP